MAVLWENLEGSLTTRLVQKDQSLVFDADWNLQWGTYHYGVGVLSIMWLPGHTNFGKF